MLLLFTVLLLAGEELIKAGISPYLVIITVIWISQIAITLSYIGASNV
jgi:hypothetical protein